MPGSERTIRAILRAEIAQFKRDMKEGANAVVEAAAKMTAADKESEKLRRGLDQLGGTAGRVGAGAVIALGLMGKAAIDWESQWAGVTKTVDGTVQQLDELQDGLRELARTMPATHEEIAATAEAAGQLGVARDDIVEFTRTMLQLGETTNLTSNDAATSIAQMANVMGTAPDEIAKVGAALVALGNDGASTEAQILDMAQRIAGAGAQIGLAESDILAIANAAASMGIEAEAGGSAISRVFTELAKATKQGGAELEQFSRIAGMSSSEFVSAFEDDPARAFAAFTAGLDQINRSGGDVFTTMEQLGLSDVRVSQALLSMAASGDLLTDSLTLGAQAFAENSALAEEYQKRAATTAAEVKVAWNNIKDAGIEAGAVLLPIVSELSEGVATLAGAFGSLPDPAQTALVGLLAITAVTGGAAWFGAKVIRGISDTKQALADLGIQSSRTKGELAKLGAIRGAALLAGVGVAATGAADKIGLTNTASLALMGTMAGGWGFALGAGAGAILDFAAAQRAGNEQVEAFTQTLDRQTGAITENSKQWLASQIKTGDLSALKEAGVDIEAMTDALLLGSEAFEEFRESTGITGRGKGSLFRDDAEDAIANLQELAFKVDEGRERWSLLEPVLASVTEGTAEYSDATGDAGDAAQQSAEQVQGLVDAMRAQRDAALAAFDAETQYRVALRDARKQAAESNAGIKGDSEAAIANRQAISELAAAWNNQSEAVKNNRKRFREARSAFIETATAMGVPIEQARQLAKRLLEIPPSVAVSVDVNGDGAITELDRIINRAKQIPRRIRTDYIVNQINSSNASSGYGGRDGDPGTPYADGGAIRGRGTKTSDSIPIWASNGEFMQPADAVDYYGLAFMEDIRKKRFPRYATGGPIGDYRAPVTGVQLGSVGAIKGFNEQLKASTKSLERERRTREQLISRRDELSGAVRDKLRSDLFGRSDTNVWASAGDRSAAGFNGVISTLRSDRANAAAVQKAITALRTKGVRGAALDELLSEGSIEEILDFSKLSKTQLGQYTSLFNQVQRGTNTVGQAAGQAAWNAQIAATTAAIKANAAGNRRVERELKAIRSSLTPAARAAGAEFGKQINQAAAGSVQKKPRGRTP